MGSIISMIYSFSNNITILFFIINHVFYRIMRWRMGSFYVRITVALMFKTSGIRMHEASASMPFERRLI